MGRGGRGALCALALLTGLRQGKLIALRWQDVVIDSPWPHLRVERSLRRDWGGPLEFGPPKTASSRGTVALGERAAALLRRQREQQQARLGTLPEPVFDDGFGDYVHPRHLRRTFQRLCREAGLPAIRFHDLRHSAATLMRRADVPMEEVSAMLRHSSPAITYHYYSHVLPDRRRVAAETPNRVLSEDAV